MTREQLEMISADPRVMHGQAVIAGTRVPVSVVLDCLAAGMTAEQITAEYPTVTAAGVRAAAAYVRVLGEDHPDTLTLRNNLAGAYRSVGDLGRAILLYEATCGRSANSPGR